MNEMTDFSDNNGFQAKDKLKEIKELVDKQE